jgi:hypothetical protein
MNDDELKQLWQRQPLREPEFSAAEVISAMQTKMSQFRRSLAARDFRELFFCGLVIIIFGFYVYNERTPIVRLGWWIVIGSSFFIAWKLVHARRSTPPAPPGATIIESLQAELKSVRTQSRLLGSVLWWYLLPPGIGLLIATWGMPVHLLAKIPATLFYVAVFGFIYWVNQWGRAKQLLPMEAQLESLLRSAETGEPLDEMQVANLRPIALSAATADHVKPAEFNVAFWQLAIWAEIGFVGMWFFWMLSLSLDNAALKPKELAPVSFAQSMRPEETNRYFGAAREITDLLNAGDYAALQKRFNPAMTKALPPEEAPEFFKGLAARFGHIENFDGPTGRSGEWVGFRLHCQRGELTMSMALNAGDKISGLYFRPAPGAFPDMNGAGWQVLTWRHFVWLGLAVLAGLLLSWLLKKVTDRAVGISALGVHLIKGHQIILWDEIKDVRTLRFVNIRSLWLIRESGEKMIMPWSSLERHSELRAAVESCAPENHPIRKYLALLR